MAGTLRPCLHPWCLREAPRDRPAIKAQALRLIRGVLPVLSDRALQPGVPAHPCGRDQPGRGSVSRLPDDAEPLVAAGHAGGRLRLRLGWALRVREEPAGDLRISVVEPDGRLAD